MIHHALDKETGIAFENVTKGMLKYLYGVYKKQTPDEYRTSYIAFIKRLKKRIPLYRNYDYKLENLGYDSYNNSLKKVLTPDEVSEVFKNELKHCFAPEDVYFRKVKLEGDGIKPLVLSEFGGKTYKADGHVFNPDKSYGYGGCKTREELNDALVKLYREQVLPAYEKGLCAAIYTQVSDVEDETNGLVTYDRQVCKVTTERMQALAKRLNDAFESQF